MYNICLNKLSISENYWKFNLWILLPLHPAPVSNIWLAGHSHSILVPSFLTQNPLVFTHIGLAVSHSSSLTEKEMNHCSQIYNLSNLRNSTSRIYFQLYKSGSRLNFRKRNQKLNISKGLFACLYILNSKGFMLYLCWMLDLFRLTK